MPPEVHKFFQAKSNRKYVIKISSAPAPLPPCMGLALKKENPKQNLAIVYLIVWIHLSMGPIKDKGQL